MNWILKLIPASWIETFVRKQAGVWINKALQAVAVSLVSKNVLAPTASASWVQANADFLIGLVIALLSAYLTKIRGDVRAADLETAKNTNSNTDIPLVLPPATSIIAGGGVGSGNTDIGRKVGLLLLCGFLCGSVNAQTIDQLPAPDPQPTATTNAPQPAVTLNGALALDLSAPRALVTALFNNVEFQNGVALPFCTSKSAKHGDVNMTLRYNTAQFLKCGSLGKGGWKVTIGPVHAMEFGSSTIDQLGIGIVTQHIRTGVTDQVMGLTHTSLFREWAISLAAVDKTTSLFQAKLRGDECRVVLAASVKF